MAMDSVLKVRRAIAASKGKAGLGGRAATLNRSAMGTQKAMDSHALRGVNSEIRAIKGTGGRAGAFFKSGWRNFSNDVAGDGTDAVKAIGGHALRGAVMGGAVGGTLEAAQGGSFWAGAKEGAFNGAVGWGAYRYAGRAYSTTGKGPGNTLRGMGAHWGVTSKNADSAIAGYRNMNAAQRANMGNVSKQYTAIQRVKQAAQNSPTKA